MFCPMFFWIPFLSLCHLSVKTCCPRVPQWGSRALCCIGRYPSGSQSCHIHPGGHTINMMFTTAYQHLQSGTVSLPADRRWFYQTLFIVTEKEKSNTPSLSLKVLLMRLNHKPAESSTICHTDFSIIQVSGMSVCRLIQINRLLVMGTGIVRCGALHSEIEMVIESYPASCMRHKGTTCTEVELSAKD